MDLSLSSLLQMARDSVQNPREGARAVLRLNPPRQARWTGLILMAVMSTVLTNLSVLMMPLEDQAMMGAFATSPLRMVVIQVAVLLIMVQAVYHVGRWRGGQGSFADALLLVGWLQFILLVLQVAQIVLQVVLPPLAEILGLLGLILFLWLLTGFVAELHGFSSTGWVFVGIMATMIGAAFVLSFALVLFLGVGV
jgi:Yip1 domain